MKMTRNGLIAGAGLALAGLGLAAGLTLRPAPPAAITTTSPETTRASLAPNESLVERGTPLPKAAPNTLLAENAPPAAKPAAVCKTCGVVESVQAVQKKGKGTGVGAVAGGVVGGAVGNQFGHGNGRAAMTVLGAVGGGLAGNEIEKRSRSTTVYQVKVRMDDGSVRHFEQAAAPAAGSRVTVDGNHLRVVSHSHAPAKRA